VSACVVRTDHIDYLVSAAVTFVAVDPLVHGVDPDELGRAFLRENIRSVMHRYDNESIDAGEVASYADMVERYRYRFRRLPVEPLQSYKVAACWKYQASAHPCLTRATSSGPVDRRVVDLR
jgi:hypothetical protein